MLLIIEKLLDPAQLARYREVLAGCHWQSGKLTAFGGSSKVKQNAQVDPQDARATGLAAELLALLGRHPLFISATLPVHIHQPRFNRYGVGESYGTHVDASIMSMPDSDQLLRSDVSMTLFLSDPADYEGGELVIEGQFGAQSVKLDAGDAVLYPSGSLHRVDAVTRGERLAAISWIQSMVASAESRAVLFDLDRAIQALGRELPAQHPQLLELGAVYHNLVRRWSQP